TELMSMLNRDASAAMVAVGPSAATDVTGFGLLGHLWEMVSGSGVGAIVNANAVPVLSEVRDLARQGVVPGGTQRNLAGLEGKIKWGAGIDEVDRLILADAQTSGGLLISVAAEKAETLRDELVRLGTPAAAEIGQIVEGNTIRVDRA
ncbi:MAG TPA: AIR synthase-related protein, partial [Chloroflexota bacterium]|nr:AIR synthase-related protein [Chloroflexota bacterium]